MRGGHLNWHLRPNSHSTPTGGRLSLDILNVQRPPLYGGSSKTLDTQSRSLEPMEAFESAKEVQGKLKLIWGYVDNGQRDPRNTEQNIFVTLFHYNES
ncbi:hypothetical protein TNCV_1951591 [Trichonephila clavipes]|nr:hypothetical protein TNCV_1951591 [Trichonephila clavipes]